MNNFLLSTASQQEIQTLDNKIHETVETINSLKTSRDFFLSFGNDPQLFIDKWLESQTKDLKTMTDVTGNPEEKRKVDYYYQPWVTEGVCRSVIISPRVQNTDVFVSDIFMERFNRKEQNWTQVWV